MKMKKSETPCYECERRTMGCHGTCPDYKAFREEISARTEMIRKQEQLDKQFTDFEINSKRLFSQRGNAIAGAKRKRGDHKW